MKVCLINPRSLAHVELAIPHGLLQICAELKKNGYDCEILNFNDPDTKASYGYINKFDVIGLSVMTTQLKHAVEIAGSVKGDKKIVWGGAHCLLDPLSILNKYRDHFVISGDGEKPLLKLLEYFEGKHDFNYISNQEGISCYANKSIINPPFFLKDLNELENINYYDLPNFEKYLYDPYSYFKKPYRINTLNVLTSRGCSWNCNFCINSIYRKHAAFHRSKAINKIREETEKVIDAFNIKVVILTDEDFFINKELTKKWESYAKEKGFFWGADSRYNYFKQGMISEQRLCELLSSGLFFVGMSIETGLEELRNKLLNKQLKDNDIFNTVGIIGRTAGKRLAVNTSFIVNFPGDTKLNKIKTIKWMDYLSKRLNIGFSGPQIYRSYPGSKLYHLEKKHETGNIDYHLNNITEVGILKPANIATFLEAMFYANILPSYFNSRFMFFELESNGKMRKIKIINKQKNSIKKILISLFFFPVKVRLYFDFWALFYDPIIIGLLFYPMQKLKKVLKIFTKN